MSEEKVTERTVTLEYPVEHDGTTYESLHLRRITAKDSLALDKVSPTKHGLALIAIIARVPIPVIEQLDVDDWEEVQRAAVPFMPRSSRQTYEAAFSAADKALAGLTPEKIEELMAKLMMDLPTE